jgi:hypothetical protein
MRYQIIIILFMVICLPAHSQEVRDSITTDTTLLVEEIHPQDVAASKFELIWKGYIKFNTFYNKNGMRSTEGFLPYEIPVDPVLNERLNGLYAGARQSRLGLETKADTRIGRIRTFLEIDFASIETRLGVRLRHAYGKIGFLTLGHTWSTFTDVSSIPRTVDLEGPPSGVSVRHGLIRYERIFEDQLVLGLSLENPLKDFQNPFDSSNVDFQQSFDAVGKFRINFENFSHFQLTAVFRDLFYRSTSGQQTIYGYGFQFSGRFYLTPADQVTTQLIIGKGISRYITTLSEKGLDAYPNQFGKLDPLQTYGGFVAYEHFWNNKWSSALITGYIKMKTHSQQPLDAYRSSLYGSINSFYEPIESLQFGAEITTGNRMNKDGSLGTASRIQFTAVFSF